MLDILSKRYARARLKGHRNFLFFELAVVKNPGAAFGLFKNNKKLLYSANILSLILVIVYFLIITDTYIRQLVLIMAAGAMGNTVDRIMHGHVTDIIRIRCSRMPYVNLADICILIPALLLIAYVVGG